MGVGGICNAALAREMLRPGAELLQNLRLRFATPTLLREISASRRSVCRWLTSACPGSWPIRYLNSTIQPLRLSRLQLASTNSEVELFSLRRLDRFRER